MNEVFNPLKRLFSNNQFTVMLLFIVAVALVIIFFGKMIAPFIGAVVISYLLEWVVLRLRSRKIPRIICVSIVFFSFFTFVFLIILIVFPLLIQQVKDLISNIPSYIALGHHLIMKLPENYPDLVSMSQAEQVINAINKEVTSFAQNFISGGVLAPLVGFVTLAIYLILVPVMVFFLLKDKNQIISWLGKYLPFDNPLLTSVWEDVDIQIGNYIRGKFTEIVIIWFASFIAFTLTDLNYALLLSFMVGISVLIPYIGAALVTIPILVVAFVQWGIGSEFYLLVGIYFIIQIIDGNVLVPLIFSEAVSIHPIAIIIAILLFGGFWGFWGVFFAIPLATLIKSVMNAWTDSLDEIKK